MTNDTFEYDNQFSVAGEDVIEEMTFQFGGIQITDPGAFQGIDQVGGRDGEKAAFHVEHQGSRETPEGQTVNEYEVEVGVVGDEGFETLDTYGMEVQGEPYAPQGIEDGRGFQEAEEFAYRVVDSFQGNMRSVDYIETSDDPTGQGQSTMSRFGGGTDELHFPLDEEEETGDGYAGVDRI
jgi:hypothetical protein